MNDISRHSDMATTDRWAAHPSRPHRNGRRVTVRPKVRLRGFRRWWYREVIGSVDHAAVATRLYQDAAWSGRYAFMVMMSAGIAVLGLLLSSPAVVIGAMLISPLMGPIIGLGFSLALLDYDEMRRSLKALAVGSAAAVSFCAFVVFLSPLQATTTEILARTRPNLFDLLVAIFSALAGSYAAIRGRGETIVGVAIATALMPPLAVVGYGLAVSNMTIFSGALALFMTNLIAIALSATVMARLYGFGVHNSHRATRLQTLVILTVFIILSVPLAVSLRQIAWEAIATRQARGAISGYFGKDARVSQLDIDFTAEPVLARAVVLTPEYRGAANQELTETLQQSMKVPVQLQLNQLIVDQDASQRQQERQELREAAALAPTVAAVVPGAAEAEQIAEQLSLVTGVRPEEVLIDAQGRQGAVQARALPGASLATWKLVEARLQQQFPDWTLRIIPPLGGLPRVGFAPGESDLSEASVQQVETIAWALSRWNVTQVSVTGRTASAGDGPRRRAAAIALARAEAVADRFRGLGFSADVAHDPIGPRQRADEREAGLGRFRSVEVAPQLERPAAQP